MARLRWKEGYVVSVRLKEGSFVLAQLLKSPYMVFFDAFEPSNDWGPNAAANARPLFFCAVTRQFLKYSPIERQKGVHAASFTDYPMCWIKRFPGSRHVTVWPGTDRERKVLLLSDRSGGFLIEKDIWAGGDQGRRVVMESIPLDDHETIDSHEMDVVWTYPNLNERLYLCKQVGENVDPEKDLTFDRPMRDEYATYIDMLAGVGGPEDWGYSSEPNP